MRYSTLIKYFVNISKKNQYKHLKYIKNMKRTNKPVF